jgi:hypothetical protein
MRRWLLVALVVSPLLLAGCQSATPLKVRPALDRLGQMTGLNPSDEEQIAGVLDDVCRGMQARQIYKVLAHVAQSYHDEEGRDYAAVETYLNEAFRNYRTIRITRVVPRITVQDDRARAIETFGTVAEPQDPQREPPINLQGQVTVDLVKVGGEWRIVQWGKIL